jgi:hypothetical protein
VTQTFGFGRKDYVGPASSEKGRSNLSAFRHASERLRDCANMRALLTKAKNAYIADLKNEMVRESSGVDLRTLFED